MAAPAPRPASLQWARTMRVLITGPSGAVGAALALALSRDHELRGFAREPARVPPIPTLELVRGDALTGEGLDEALDGIEVAYYLIHSMEPPSARGSSRATARRRGGSPPRPPARGVRRIVYLGGILPASGAALAAPREPPRGRADPGRGRARQRRAARLDRDRRALGVVPRDRAADRAAAGDPAAAVATQPHAADRRARRRRVPRGGRRPARGRGGRSTSRARRCCPTAR